MYGLGGSTQMFMDETELDVGKEWRSWPELSSCCLSPAPQMLGQPYLKDCDSRFRGVSVCYLIL